MADLSSLSKNPVKLPNGQPTRTAPESSGFTDALVATNGLKIDYYIERREQGKTVITMPMPEQPESVTIERLYDENPVYTFATDFTYREIALPRRAVITISGFVGGKQRLGVDDKGSVSFVTGEEHLLNFQKFIDTYFRDASNTPTPVARGMQYLDNDFDYEARPYMVFKAVKENIYARCRIESFTYTRSLERSRLKGYMWTLKIHAYDAIQPPVPTGWAAFTEWSNGITGAISTASAYMFAADAILRGGTTQVVNSINKPLGALRAIPRAVETLTTSPLAVVDGAMTVVRNVGDTLGAVTELFTGEYWGGIGAAYGDYFDSPRFTTAGDGYKRMWQNTHLDKLWNPFEDDVPALAPRQSTVRRSQSLELAQTNQMLSVMMMEGMYAMERVYGYTSTFPSSSLGSQPPGFGFLDRLDGFSLLASRDGMVPLQPAVRQEFNRTFDYILQVGENLINIATRFFDSATQWHELAILNDCRDAYTRNDGRPLTPGSVIKIPIVGVQGLTEILSSPQADRLNAYLGVDIMLTSDGDFDLDLDNMEFRMTRADQTLRQAIAMTLRTLLGEIPMTPAFGSINLIGTKLSTSYAALYVSRITEALLADPRIMEVTDVEVNINSEVSGLDVSLTVVTIDGRAINTILPL